MQVGYSMQAFSWQQPRLQQRCQVHTNWTDQKQRKNKPRETKDYSPKRKLLDH